MAVESLDKNLIINTGSASHKYALYRGVEELISVHLEKEGTGFIASIKLGPQEQKESISSFQYDSPIEFLLELLIAKSLIITKQEIVLVGLRIVAPGEYFLSHNIIDNEYLSKLEEAVEQAPLHIAPIISEINYAKKALPEARLFGVSDSLFHKNLPEKAREYAISSTDRVQFGIKRFGYHGISISSVLYKLENLLGKIPDKIIVCHLGSGSSITAIKNGQSIDTSMGFTPLEGVPMASRVGNIDPGAVTYLGLKKKLNFQELDSYFNLQCGLYALSEKTGDIRELIELEKGGDVNAKLALDIFIYSIKKYIGAYVAALGGLDLLVFTATIGERSNIIRGRICEGMKTFGILLDENKNDNTISKDGFINVDDNVPIAVIKTDEMREIAREINKLIG